MAGLEDPHLGGAYDVGDGNTWMPDVWERLVADYGIRSVADVGCGYGHNATWFLDRKFDVLGIEGDPVCIEKSHLPKDNLIVHDYTKGPLTIRPMDLCWCSEFVEHVEERYMINYLTTFKCCRWLCLTHGEPGQDGFHHVNLRPSQWWWDKLLDYGFQVDPNETLKLRATDTFNAGWGRRTLCWFINLDWK